MERELSHDHDQASPSRPEAAEAASPQPVADPGRLLGGRRPAPDGMPANGLPLLRSAILSAQTSHGNAFVQRQLTQREDDGGPQTTLGDGTAIVEASGGTVDVSAAMMNAHTGFAKYDGVLQADTIIANSVVASSYTPGAGNIM